MSVLLTNYAGVDKPYSVLCALCSVLCALCLIVGRHTYYSFYSVIGKQLVKATVDMGAKFFVKSIAENSMSI